MTTFIKDTKKNRLINISKASYIEYVEPDCAICIYYINKAFPFMIKYENKYDTLAAYEQICTSIINGNHLICI